MLILGPVPPPLGGQALVTKLVLSVVPDHIVINTNTIGKNRVWSNFKSIVRIMVLGLLMFRVRLVYITLSRQVLSSYKDFILILLASACKKKIVVHMHGNDLDYLDRVGVYGLIRDYCYSKIDTCVYITNYQMSLRKTLGVNSTVIYNSVPERMTHDNSFTQSKCNWLFVSVILYSKGIMHTLEAFKRVAIINDAINLTIAGDFGSDDYFSKAEIKKMVLDKIASINLLVGKKIHFLGEISGEEKRLAFQKADVFIFPTFFKSESFGLVLIEAMMSGCIIACSDLPFLEEVIGDRYFGFEPMNTDALEQVLLQILNEIHDVAEIKSSNAVFAEERFSPEIFKDKLRNVLG